MRNNNEICSNVPRAVRAPEVCVCPNRGPMVSTADFKTTPSGHFTLVSLDGHVVGSITEIHGGLEVMVWSLDGKALKGESYFDATPENFKSAQCWARGIAAHLNPTLTAWVPKLAV